MLYKVGDIVRSGRGPLPGTKALVFWLLLAYLSIGIFPFAHYETDAMGVVAGCRKIVETGMFSENYYTYGFEMQPGIYFWIIGLSRLFQVDLVTSYSILSALFGVGFLLVSARLVSMLTGAAYYTAGLLLLLFQEVYSAWYYMNSATTAGFLLILGLVVIASPPTVYRFVTGSLLLALAAWTRLDVILVFPVLLFLIDRKTFRERLLWSMGFAVLVLAGMGLLYTLSNVPFVSLLTSSAGGNSISLSDNIKTAGGFFSSQMIRSVAGFMSLLLAVLIAVGSWKLWKDRRWNLLFSTWVPVVLFLLILKGNITAGKHLLYYIPLLGIPVAVSWQQLEMAFSKRLYPGLMVVGALLFLGQYLIGFQIYFKKYPYIGKSYSSVYPSPTYLNLARLRFDRGPLDSVVVVVGGGMKLATADEMLLSSGIAFSPLMWHDLKKDSQQIYGSLSALVNGRQQDTLFVTVSQSGAYPIRNLLYLSDYHLTNQEASTYTWGVDYRYIWKRNRAFVVVEQASYPKEAQSYIARAKEIKHPVSLHLALWDWEKEIMEGSGYVKKINNAGYLLRYSDEQTR